MKKPNIVFIVADDLGYGDLGCCGNGGVRTPHIDRLAREGSLLRQHYSASPLCAPARAALLTGRYNHRTGAVDVSSNRGLDRIALDEKLMPEYFRDAGYATCMIGKWHNGLHDMRHHPRARGFDEFYGFLNGGMDYYDWALDWNGETKYADGRYLTDVFTNAAVEFVGRAADSGDGAAKPFYLYLAYNAPHSPRQAPEETIETYRRMNRFSEPVCAIYAMIEHLDRGVGEIVRSLEEAGVREETLIVVTSDNGPDFTGGAERWNGPLSGCKGDVLEGGIRVPAIVSWPGRVPVGVRSDSLIHFCDWLPSLLAWAGIEPRSGKPFDGVDQRDALAGRSSESSRPRFWQRNRYAPVARCNAAMRDGDWKLVMPMRDGADVKERSDQGFYEHGLRAPHWLMEVNPRLPSRNIGSAPPPRLFNVADDIGEQHDLANRHPDRAAEMLSAWDAWFREVDAEWKASYRENVGAPGDIGSTACAGGGG
jgi:arylsulfatase A-like enzyme